MKRLKPVLIIIVGLLIVTVVSVAFGDNPVVAGRKDLFAPILPCSTFSAPRDPRGEGKK